MYIRLSDGRVAKRPAVPENVSLPRNPSDADLARLGYARIHPTPRPTGDVVTQGQPEQRDGKWYQTWIVREFTAEELEQRRLDRETRLLADLEDARKAAEAEGVNINGIRYRGDPSNRQALDESLQFAVASSAATFPGWKDSDGQFHTDHPVADVQAAYEAIGYRRGALIALEGQYTAQIKKGELTDMEAVSWEI